MLLAGEPGSIFGGFRSQLYEVPRLQDEAKRRVSHWKRLRWTLSRASLFYYQALRWRVNINKRIGRSSMERYIMELWGLTTSSFLLDPTLRVSACLHCLSYSYSPLCLLSQILFIFSSLWFSFFFLPCSLDSNNDTGGGNYLVLFLFISLDK